MPRPPVRPEAADVQHQPRALPGLPVHRQPGELLERLQHLPVLADELAHVSADDADRGAVTFHDVQVRYSLPWDATVSVGANNVFEKTGPIMYSKPNSAFSYYGGYDIGRFIYMKYQQRF